MRAIETVRFLILAEIERLCQRAFQQYLVFSMVWDARRHARAVRCPGDELTSSKRAPQSQKPRNSDVKVSNTRFTISMAGCMTNSVTNSRTQRRNRYGITASKRILNQLKSLYTR